MKGFDVSVRVYAPETELFVSCGGFCGLVVGATGIGGVIGVFAARTAAEGRKSGVLTVDVDMTE